MIGMLWLRVRELCATNLHVPVLLWCAFLVAGCDLLRNGGVNAPAPRQVDSGRASPESLLWHFSLAHADSSRSLAEIMSSLHPAFLFRFTQRDREAWPSLPESLDRDGMQLALERLFGDAASVRLIIAPRDRSAVEPCTSEPGAPSCRLYEAAIALNAEFTAHPEADLCSVQGMADLALTPDPADPQAWVIYEILDRTTEEALWYSPGGCAPLGPQAVYAITWGELLGSYFLYNRPPIGFAGALFGRSDPIVPRALR